MRTSGRFVGACSEYPKSRNTRATVTAVTGWSRWLSSAAIARVDLLAMVARDMSVSRMYNTTSNITRLFFSKPFM